VTVSRALSSFSLPLLLLACGTDAGGPRPVSIGVRVTDETMIDEAETCVRMPVLLGSRVRELTEVPSGFQIEINASRDWVRVGFPGALEAGEMEATGQLLDGGHSDNVAIVDQSGGLHTGYLYTGCTRVDAPAEE
jgi:hypothetical protein